MNTTSKILIVFALMCVSAAAAYSQDCNRYLQQATEMVSQKQYCDALSYYRAYSKCNADADVSTEIAMCERFCKIRVMEGDEVEPVGVTEWYNPAQTNTSSSNRNVMPDPGVSRNRKFKLGLNGGIMSATEKGSEIHFGGGISGEYLATPNIGIGLSVSGYAYQVESGGLRQTTFFIPTTLTGKFYFLTKSVQPYGGVDIGLYTMGVQRSSGGQSASYSESYFGLAPVLGSQFKLSKALALDINAKYNVIFVQGNTGYNVSANLGLVFYF